MTENNAPPSIFRRLLVVPFFFILMTWHAALLVSWLHRDTAPVKWDESVHLSSALRYKEAFASFSVRELLSVKPWPGHPPYPPLVHYAMAPFIAVAQAAGSPPEDAAAFANLIFIFLLGLGAYWLASHWWGLGAGLCAAYLATLLPPVVMHARAPLVDLGLTAWVVLAYACWARSENFSNRRWSLALGLCGGL